VYEREGVDQEEREGVDVIEGTDDREAEIENYYEGENRGQHYTNDNENNEDYNIEDQNTPSPNKLRQSYNLNSESSRNDQMNPNNKYAGFKSDSFNEDKPDPESKQNTLQHENQNQEKERFKNYSFRNDHVQKNNNSIKGNGKLVPLFSYKTIHITFTFFNLLLLTIYRFKSKLKQIHK
jgi:hypothetical protein